MSNHPTTRSSTTIINDLNETMKKTPSPRRQTTRSISNLNKDISPSINNNEQCIQVIKPVAVRPPSSDSTQNPYNLRSRTKLKNSNNEVIPSFTEKLSLETPIIQQKPMPPLTRAAAASAGVKIDSFISDELIKTNTKQTTNRSSTTRKRKASEDDHRPYLDLLKMKQVIEQKKYIYSIYKIIDRIVICMLDRIKRIRSTLMEFRASSSRESIYTLFRFLFKLFFLA
jgi:hypothetical protein